jgi:hypothetical protein
MHRWVRFDVSSYTVAGWHPSIGAKTDGDGENRVPWRWVTIAAAAVGAYRAARAVIAPLFARAA